MFIEILGLIFSIILGTIGHFLYDITNKNKIMGFLFAKNESVWEHLKLGITPIMLWTIVELLTFNFSNLFFAKFISILAFIFSLIFMYFGLKCIIKKNILFIDISIFYLSLGLAYYTSIKLLAGSSSFILNLFGFIGMFFIIYTYIKFNKKTTFKSIFKTP